MANPPIAPNEPLPTGSLGFESPVNPWYSSLIPWLITVPVAAYGFSGLWYGRPTAIHCWQLSSSQIDCNLTHRALLRSWVRPVPAVTAIAIDTRVDYTENSEPQTQYLAVLKTQEKTYLIKTYVHYADPELESLHHRINRFVENPKNPLDLSVHYNPWRPFIIILAIVTFPIMGLILTMIPLVLLGLVISIYSAIQGNS